ncbi:MAG: tryptophan synthase subunit alpha [Chloroflexota bacterium]|nr:tryptophan synthase subunit alpha [Chloroflexota bacterium]
MSRTSRTFERLREERRCGLFPFLVAGFPDVATSHALAEAALDAGADGFEIGVPFSDPLADGATHQRIYARALAGGATLDTALDLARTIRRRSPDTPVALMSYYNPLRQRGDVRLAAQLAEIEVDAAIVPDLPPEEADEFRSALLAHGLGLVPLLAPTSLEARIRAVAALDPLWIYCVALVGVTGARQNLSTDLAAFLDRVRAATSAPLVVGFGISQPDHVQRVARLGAAGAIVGSALSDLVERSDDPVTAVRGYLGEMKLAGASGAVAR